MPETQTTTETVRAVLAEQRVIPPWIKDVVDGLKPEDFVRVTRIVLPLSSHIIAVERIENPGSSVKCTLEITAHHEAAHGVVLYRKAGYVGGEISIIPDPTKHILGSAKDDAADSSSSEDMEARILSCYAGGHAQQVIDPARGNAGCGVDEEIADDLIWQFGWENREQELRDRSLDLTVAHWGEIVAVAQQLVQHRTLYEEEVMLIADAAAGDESAVQHLSDYRTLRRRNDQ